MESDESATAEEEEEEEEVGSSAGGSNAPLAEEEEGDDVLIIPPPANAAATATTTTTTVVAPAPAVAVVVPLPWPPLVPIGPVTVTNPQGFFITLANVLAAPAQQGPVNLGPPPPAAGTPRATWDRQPPAAVTVQDWANTQFVNIPADAWFTPRSQGQPVAVPGLPPWTGQQPPSTRECRWALEPVLRSIPFCGFGRPAQLAIRYQVGMRIFVIILDLLIQTGTGTPGRCSLLSKHTGHTRNRDFF